MPDGERLGDQFAEHYRDIGDDAHHQRHGDRLGHSLDDRDRDQENERLDMYDGDHAADGRGKRADQGDADLDRSEKPFGLLLQALDPAGGAVTALYELTDAALPERDQGYLGSSKKTVHDDEEKDQENIR